VGVWLVAIPIAIVAIVAYTVYLKSKHAKGELAPEETTDRTKPARGRDHEWDPSDRYDGGEPPAAR
jgi:hypothetical protein